MEKRLILVLCFFLGGCSLLTSPFKLFKMGAPNQEQKSSTEIIESEEPVYDKTFDKNGNIIITPLGVKKNREYRTDWQQKDREKSLFQKVWNGFLQMGIIGIILAVLAFLFPPVAMVLGFAGRATEYGTRRIVNGLDKALMNVKDPESKKIIYETLSKEYDPKTKLMVAKMRHKGTGSG